VKKRILLLFIVLVVVVGIILDNQGEDPIQENTSVEPSPGETPTETPEEQPDEEIVEAASDYPKIASWLAKNDELLESGKPYDLVMSGWFTPEEAAQYRANNPDVLLLAGLTTTWVWDNEGWMSFLLTIANYGREETLEITEEMYLHKSDGSRCPFGWESDEWGQEEIYAMDPRNEEWVTLVVNFYETVLDLPTHDGIIVDMVVERQYWGQDAITDEEWTEATKDIYQRIMNLNTEGKLVIFNSGARLSDIDDYSEYFDGYLMENFMGDQLKTTYSEGLEVVGSDKLVIFNVDTDDTGVIDMDKMRLGLTLSLLGDNTYFTYDFGPRDHGQAWWYPEYDVELGIPQGDYYEKDGAYYRDYEKGVVVSAPDGASVSFDEEHVDASTGETSKTFTIEPGDGRIYLLKSITG
jgi:hypothetical protein